MKQTIQYTASGAAALVMTVSLGLVMAKMVHVNMIKLPEKPEKLSMIITPQITQPPIINTKKPEKFIRVETPPALPRLRTTPSTPVDVPPSGLWDKFPQHLHPKDIMIPIAVSFDLDLTPIFRAAPIMPMRADRSGFCEMMFDVNANGTTYNVRVLNCSQNLFARASVKSVRKWKYRPQTIDGKTLPRADLRTTISFELTDEQGRLIPQ